ncbi:MAG: hypothetical protein MZV64_23250 [Ignavibacteriales bacterium]|nr:hypothetical protein [Ignavibacteriales bacterium]
MDNASRATPTTAVMTLFLRRIAAAYLRAAVTYSTCNGVGAGSLPAAPSLIKVTASCRSFPRTR